ncbi:MAG TPA: amidohydrolase family protein, partial [Desulfobacteria bacterium]|nr:amidohydrolase family protein [Desulfobacteria bacterium]
MRILFKNATIVTMNAQRDIFLGDLLVENSSISAIGKNIKQPADRVIDVGGNLLIPGLIQTHIHLCQTLFRGQADDLELLDWLKLKVWPLEGAHDPESLYDSALLGIGELFLGGTTTIVDMETVHHTEHAFRAILESGLRAVSGKCMMDDPSGGVPQSLQETTTDSLQESVDLYEKYDGAGNGRLEVAFTPRFAVSCT